MAARYIHERRDWPRFHWDSASLTNPLAAVRHRQGRLVGRLEALGFGFQDEAVLATLTQEVVTSSEIEGEVLDRRQVRSSIARRLGIDIGALARVDRAVEGVVEMVLDATRRFEAPLTAERLFGWHAALFPTGRSHLRRIRVGKWRDDREGPMQVVSGPIGRERVHYEAPAAERLPGEMAAFLDWFEAAGAADPVLRAALAHLWLVTIHPFDDGNGRIARAVADLALARSDGSARRFYSMSAQIRLERNDYYDLLERTQKGTLDVTPWMEWFLGCLGRAAAGAEATLETVLAKARFWERHGAAMLNERQRRILNALLDGFDGKLTTSKYAKTTGCSQDTALRDIEALIHLGALIKDGAGGRSTSYSLRRA
jgi:Fic family protein